MASVLQEWVMKLPLKMQATLISAVRSCDGELPGPHKELTKMVRKKILIAAHKNPKSFLNAQFDTQLFNIADDFISHHDHLPIHFVTHLMHAIEVIGYYYPVVKIRLKYMKVYEVWCARMHLRHETKHMLEKRLS